MPTLEIYLAAGHAEATALVAALSETGAAVLDTPLEPPA
jgi:hypothetical protein